MKIRYDNLGFVGFWLFIAGIAHSIFSSGNVAFIEYIQTGTIWTNWQTSFLLVFVGFILMIIHKD